MTRRDGLIPRAAVFYDRRAFHGADDPELRLTLDGNIRYRLGDLDLRNGTDGDTIPGLAVPDKWEIKSASSIPLWLAGALSELGDTPRLVFKVRLGLQTALSGSLHHIILLWSDSFE